MAMYLFSYILEHPNIYIYISEELAKVVGSAPPPPPVPQSGGGAPHTYWKMNYKKMRVL